MLTRLLCGSAVALLLAGPVLAQSDKMAPGDSPPTAARSATVPGDNAASRLKASATPTVTPPSSDAFITTQSPDQILADDLIGAHVVNGEHQKVGTVNDIVLDHSGKAVGVVISVGGFLGIGDKHVAVNWDKLERRSSEGFVVTWTKDELKLAPEFKTAARLKSEQDLAARQAMPPAGMRTTSPAIAPADRGANTGPANVTR